MWGRRLTIDERAGAQQRFLDAFKASGNITAACRIAGIDRRSFYRWKEEDGAFLTAYQYAEEEAMDLLDLSARQRAVCGVERIVVSGGKIVTIPDGNGGEKPLIQREYSDAVLLALLRAHHPLYRPQQHVRVSSGTTRQKTLDEIADILKRLQSYHPSQGDDTNEV